MTRQTIALRRVTAAFLFAGVTTHAGLGLRIVIGLFFFDLCEFWPSVTGFAGLVFAMSNRLGFLFVELRFVRLRIVTLSAVGREVYMPESQLRVPLRFVLNFRLLRSTGGPEENQQSDENVFQNNSHYPAFTGSPNLVSI